MLVQNLLRSQERRLFVQRLTRPRDEGRGNTKRGSVGILEDVSRAGDVPSGISTRFECRPDTSVGEARSVRLALNEGFPGKFGECSSFTVWREEAVVFLGSEPGQRIKDVRVMSSALFDRPVLHRRRDGVRDSWVQGRSRIDRSHQRLVDRLRQPRLHHRLAEDIRPEELASGDLRERQRRRYWMIVGDGLDSLKTTRTSAQDRLPP